MENEYVVKMTRSVVVNAKNEEDAIDKAFDLYAEDMDNSEITVDLLNKGE